MDVPVPGEHYAQNSMSVVAVVKAECPEHSA